MKRITLALGGMTCGHCVGSVRRALGAVDGVTVEDVRVGSATFTLDDGIVTVDEIAAAVEEAGYRVLSEQSVGGAAST